MSFIKPIKRSKQLAPLSREHHDVLMFAWNIKQGLNNWTPAEEISPYVRWYWSNFMQPHFDQEENILVADLPASDELKQQLKTEHDNIRELIGGPLSKSALIILAEVINDHIRFEERRLFPHIEHTLTKEQLNHIYRQLEQQPQCHEKWGNEFWKRKLG
ncbi:MAG: hemerythrin domain-containing protein [Bacteroidota bacterium]|nr:hemerythrin domain-containing protein [Bacteroidota bacterium]